MNENNITEINKNLQEEEKELTEEYTKLEQQLNDLQTVIRCQTQKNEIIEKMKKITFRLFEIKSDLLGESEQVRKIKEEMEN